MRRRHVLSILTALVPVAASGAAQPLGVLWRHGHDVVLTTSCPNGMDSDASCHALAARHAGTTTPIGAGYIVTRLLWVRSGPARGPDILVRGDRGGSGGTADVFAVTFAPRFALREWHGDRYAEIEGRTVRGALQIALPFTIEFFNGASHADGTIVPIPMRWKGDDFAVDFPALVRPPLSPDERAFRTLAVRSELARWSTDAFPANRLYPPERPIAHATTPVTVRALADLMLTGRADAARTMLHRTWPRSREGGGLAMAGEDAFWAALCVRLVSHPLWRRLRLDLLPHADLIRAGAR